MNAPVAPQALDDPAAIARLVRELLEFESPEELETEIADAPDAERRIIFHGLQQIAQPGHLLGSEEWLVKLRETLLHGIAERYAQRELKRRLAMKALLAEIEPF